MREKKIYIVPDGGVANRCRAIVSALSLARDCNRIPVIVWHRDNLCNADIEDILDTSYLKAEIIRPSAVDFNIYYSLPRLKNLYLSEFAARKRFAKCYYDNKNLLAYLDDCDKLREEVVATNGDILIFSGQEYYDFTPPFFRQYIRASIEAEKRAEEILSQYARRPQIALQIRRTDNVKAMQLSPVGMFIDEVEVHPKDIFYLATDDEAVKAAFHDRFGSRVLFNPHPARRDTRRGIIDAMAEIVIMSRCRYIYGSAHSSFPEMAARLGNTKLEILTN